MDVLDKAIDDQRVRFNAFCSAYEPWQACLYGRLWFSFSPPIPFPLILFYSSSSPASLIFLSFPDCSGFHFAVCGRVFSVESDFSGAVPLSSHQAICLSPGSEISYSWQLYQKGAFQGEKGLFDSHERKKKKKKKKKKICMWSFLTLLLVYLSCQQSNQ